MLLKPCHIDDGSRLSGYTVTSPQTVKPLNTLEVQRPFCYESGARLGTDMSMDSATWLQLDNT